MPGGERQQLGVFLKRKLVNLTITTQESPIVILTKEESVKRHAYVCLSVNRCFVPQHDKVASARKNPLNAMLSLPIG
ncbi:hypothetical protein A0256_05425 [Mucilaginibacter sp. PAMC 26640]|nr:hypothetical protein A0256_05425 [Mucilaginibacter sp. PAMC 26640]